MKPLFDSAGASVLDSLADADALLAFDFDGTLAPIVAQRTQARMRPSTARLFHALCTQARCVVISGRARADVSQRLGDAPVLAVIGNHGADDGRVVPGSTAALMREVTGALARELEVGDLDLEDKDFSLSIHFPHTPGIDTAVRYNRVLATLQALGPRLRLLAGHYVINVLPAESMHKGDALQGVLSQYRADRALFVGDDHTDEDVFRLRLPGLTGVRVGYSPSSRADYFIAGQDDIDRLLETLLQRRSRSRPSWAAG